MAVPTSGVGGAAVAFNPSLHPRAPKGPGGGKFTAASGGQQAAAKNAPAKKTAQPNGLGYSAAQWAQLQSLEKAAKAGKKLDAHQEHELHVAHEKHLAALHIKPAAKKPAAKKPVAKKATVKKTTAAKPKTTAKSAGVVSRIS